VSSRILSLWLPNLATDRLLRRAGSDLRQGRPGAANAPDLNGGCGGGGGRAPLRPDRPLATFASQAAALGFAMALLARLLAGQGHAVWIGPRDDLFAPGLAALGLAPERLILVRARARDAGLWALEEALRTPGLAAALAEVDQLTLTQSRRLQLAAEAKGVTAFLLRPRRAAATPGAATTRWRIAAAPSQAGGRDLGPPRWRVELMRCRGGRTGVWQVEWQSGGWREIEDPLPVAAESGDRPAAPARRERSQAGQARGRERA